MRKVGWNGLRLILNSPLESWCLCQQFRNQQATWRWVITRSTKPKALLQHPSGQWRKPAARQEGKLRHSSHLSITISSSAC